MKEETLFRGILKLARPIKLSDCRKIYQLLKLFEGIYFEKGLERAQETYWLDNSMEWE